jgi:anti-sigma regulatory factor (Ser/Thr protein kinase)
VSRTVSEFSPPWTGRAHDGIGSVPDVFYSLGLTTVPASSYVARNKAQFILKEWRLSRDDAATALLLISELVTNAVRFGSVPGIPDPAQITLALRLLRDLLVIEVSDQSPDLPVRRSADWDSESGRGLNLISDLSREWNYYVPRPGWKTVYCVLAIEA